MITSKTLKLIFDTNPCSTLLSHIRRIISRVICNKYIVLRYLATDCLLKVDKLLLKPKVDSIHIQHGYGDDWDLEFLEM